ncbi:MAG TPA: hypothetical protein VHA56_01435 [Mucilaginibacter sp.]|nr:hypothetical protein [Mucilaginibacter sp.]
MTPRIELLKTRDFGEIISDTFLFIRQNLKPLVSCFFIFCGFFLIAATVTSILQQIKVLSLFNGGFDTAGPTRPLIGSSRFFANFGIEYFLSILFLWLNYITITATVYSYISLYREKGNVAPTVAEVWGYIKYFFLRLFGSSFVLGLLLIAATILCIIPGVYLYPIIALMFPVMVFENASLGYAFNKSFKLIKDNWWVTFGCLFVMGLIVYFAVSIFVVPLTLLNVGSMFIHRSNGMHLSVTLTVLTVVVQHLCQIFYIMPLVTVSLCYFNLSERTDGTGLLNRISQLGNNVEGDNAAPTEEY